MRRGPCNNDASHKGLGGSDDGRVERDFEIFLSDGFVESKLYILTTVEFP